MGLRPGCVRMWPSGGRALSATPCAAMGLTITAIGDDDGNECVAESYCSIAWTYDGDVAECPEVQIIISDPDGAVLNSATEANDGFAACETPPKDEFVVDYELAMLCAAEPACGGPAMNFQLMFPPTPHPTITWS